MGATLVFRLEYLLNLRELLGKGPRENKTHTLLKFDNQPQPHVLTHAQTLFRALILVHKWSSLCDFLKQLGIQFFFSFLMDEVKNFLEK